MQKLSKIDFIGIGAHKSATTWLARCLSEHSEICLPANKETHFFSNDAKFSKGIEFYFSHFTNCNNQKIIGEFATTYLSNPDAPGRIKEYFPNAKIIVSLRDPFERAVSHIKHLISKGWISEQDGIKDMVKKHPEIVEYGLYEKHLPAYIKLFGRENVYIIGYDDISRDPQKVLKSLYKFLDVDSSFIPRSANVKYHTSSALNSRFYKLIHKLRFAFKRNAFGRRILRFLRKAGLNSQFLYKFFGRKDYVLTFTERDEYYLKSFFK